MAIRWGRRGPRLAGGSLAFDTFGEAGATFVSQPDLRIPPRPGRLILSDLAAQLVGARADQALAPPLRRRFTLGELELELLPTGAGVGAAALAIGVRGDLVIYAGEVGLESPFGLGEKRLARKCRQLVVTPVYDQPRDLFPPAQEAFGQLCELLRDALAVGDVPVLRGRALGRCLAMVAPLSDQGFTVCVHRRVHQALGVLRRAGLPVGRARRYAGQAVPGEVLLWPVEAAPPLKPAGAALRQVLVSGRAVRPAAAGEAGCELGVPIADRADLPSLVAYIRACRPEVVSFTRVPSAALSDALSHEGIAHEVLGPVAQLSMFG